VVSTTHVIEECPKCKRESDEYRAAARERRSVREEKVG